MAHCLPMRGGHCREDLTWDNNVWLRLFSCLKTSSDKDCYFSVNRLDTGYVDLYLIHAPTGGDVLRTYDAMIDLKNQGLIR